MPDTDGRQLLEKVRAEFPEVAVIMITGTDDVRREVQVIREGASDYLLKPFQMNTVITSVRQALETKRLERESDKHRRELEQTVDRRTKQLKRAQKQVEKMHDEAAMALGQVLDLQDNETARHCECGTRYSLELAKAVGRPTDQLGEIARGACLHDIGKVEIPDSILLKPGPLTRDEEAVMRTHVYHGYELVTRISFPAASAAIVLTHHERFDGTGYPQGLAGANIPIGSRIFAVADTLDAMTSDRPYRKALPYSAARDEIIRESGRQFDPEVVQAFVSLPEQVWEQIRTEVMASGRTSLSKHCYLRYLDSVRNQITGQKG